MCVLAACGTPDDSSSLDNPSGSVPSLFEANIGELSFPVSCSARAAEVVSRGVVLLHHMMYDSARLAFAMAENMDANCVMALWGQAMTEIHPLWPDRPTETALAWGAEVVQRAAEVQVATARESDYLATVTAYFEPHANDTEQARLNRFEAAWQHVSQAHPEDLEAQLFFALSHIATADKGDKSYAQQRRAGEIAQRVLTEFPDHPGAHHYLIHAYDNPVLAPSAKPVADRYGAMTPAVPHATHMMTHIYTRLGDWQQSITWNRKSADAAWALCLELGEVTSHYQHALDYLAYAHLQLGADSAALAVVSDMAQLQGPFTAGNRAAAAYAFAALPARYHLERHDWQAAAELVPRSPSAFPWSDADAPYVAISHFARALGMAHSEAFPAAEVEVSVLKDLAGTMRESDPYWANQIDIQVTAVQGWIEYLRGQQELGLATLRSASAMEQATQKSPVTPGEVLPATELLADMLLDAGLVAEALAAYELSLQRSPNRLNSLFGAASAAAQMGVHERAEEMFMAVSESLGHDHERPAMAATVKEYLAKRARPG
jgi:tetratricopeptide (TPR) repeat protein